MQTIFIRKFYPNLIIQGEFWNFVKSEELQTCNLKFCEIKLKDLRRVSFIQKFWGYLTKSLKVFSWSISDLVYWWLSVRRNSLITKHLWKYQNKWISAIHSTTTSTTLGSELSFDSTTQSDKTAVTPGRTEGRFTRKKCVKLQATYHT